MEQLQHRGIITSISGNEIKVQITNCSACENCEGRHGCQLMEFKHKNIDVFTEVASSYHIGEEVIISLDLKDGFKAVFYSYVLPLFLVVSILIIFASFGAGELTSGISAIIILIPYYFWLFLKTKQLKRQFKFKINKI